MCSFKRLNDMPKQSFIYVDQKLQKYAINDKQQQMRTQILLF